MFFNKLECLSFQAKSNVCKEMFFQILDKEWND